MDKPSTSGSTQRFETSDAELTLDVDPTWLATEDPLERNTDLEIAKKLQEWEHAGLEKQIKERVKIAEAIHMKIDAVKVKFEEHTRMNETTRRTNAEYEEELSKLADIEIQISEIGTELGMLERFSRKLNFQYMEPLTYEYEGTSEHHHITGYKYAIGDKTLSNNTMRRYHHGQAKYFESSISTSEDFDQQQTDVVNVGECFCSGDCLPKGVLNVSACRHGAPAFVSLPHFYKADPIYQDAIEGMNPDPEKHDFHITLEPTTGIPLNVAARLQINIMLHPSPSISVFEDVPTVMFPMLWFNEHVGITEDMASSLRLLSNLPSIVFYSSIAMVIVGSLIVISAGVLNYLHKRRNSKSSLKQLASVSPGQKSELVHFDTTLPNEESESNESTTLSSPHGK